jgi:hypothetical protein
MAPVSNANIVLVTEREAFLRDPLIKPANAAQQMDKNVGK